MIATPIGYSIDRDMGGERFHREFRANDNHLIGYALITKPTDPDLPETAEEPVALGLYDANSDGFVMIACANLAEAVAIADKVTYFGS